MLTSIFILCTILYSSSAYITKFPDFWYLENFNYGVEGNEESKHHDVIENKGPLWVVDISQGNMWQPLQLKKANEDERNDFDSVIGPVIKFYESRRKQRSNKTNRKTSKNIIEEIKSKDVVGDILEMVNKFVLSALDVDPEVQLPDTDDEYTAPSVAIFFKQLYTAMFIKYGRNEWHFFVRPPSPFPAWFFEDHEHCSAINQGSIELPKEVENEFYQQLLRLMRKYFSRLDL